MNDAPAGDAAEGDSAARGPSDSVEVGVAAIRPANPAAKLLSLTQGYIVTQAVAAVAELKIADLLAGGPRPVGDLAKDSGADPDALRRILRALASLGVFDEHEGDYFALTPVGELLRSDTSSSLRAHSLMSAGVQYRVFQSILHSVRTGAPAFDHLFDKHHFEWLAEEPTEAEQFDRAMAGSAARRVPLLLDYDWSLVTTVVDVGGGNGALLTALLTRNPNLRGTLFDLPYTLDRALAQFAAAGLAHRTDAVGGDFFDAVPPGADRYVLSKILHDWNDEDAVRILRSCRRAIRENGKLLVLEWVVPEANEPHPAWLIDLVMLVMNGGRERTSRQWRELLAAGGFRLSDIKESPSSSLLEAEPN